MLLEHILGSISPASVAMATEAARRVAAGLSSGDQLGKLAELAARLAGARHDLHPPLSKRSLLVCGADHGVAYPGIDLGIDGPAAHSMRQLASGTSAVSAAARTARADVLLVDTGIRGGETIELGRGVLGFRLGEGTADITAGPAMDEGTVHAALETGIALAVSLGDAGLDLLALGQIGPGTEVASGAILCAMTGCAPHEVAGLGEDAEAITRALAANADAVAGDDALAILAAVGGFEIAVQTGVILATASVHRPIVLDDRGTWASALIARALCKDVTGYLFAAHAGSRPGYRRALDALAISPLLDLGLAHGEGTGALLAVPLFDAAAGLLLGAESA